MKKTAEYPFKAMDIRCRVAEEDVNLDGKADVLGLSIKMPLERNFHVLLVKLLLLFDCKVQNHARVSYEGLAFVEHGSALPGAALLVTGELRWRQQQPLHHNARDDRYKVCSEVVHPPSPAHCGRDGAEPPGSVSGSSPTGLRWWAAVVGLFWCCRLHDGLAAPHCRPARTATPGSSGVSAVPVMLCRAVAAAVKCLELELSFSSAWCVAEEDVNLDGKADVLGLSIKMPVEQNFHVLLVKLLLLFDCKVQNHARVSYEGLAFVEHGSALPGAALLVTGELRWRQQQPLHHNARDDRYKRSVIDNSRLSSFALERILKDYAKRNVTTHLSNVLSTWKKAKGTPSHFEITVKIRYPTEVILFRPGLWQVLKQAWIQYLAFLFVFLMVGRCAKEFVLGSRILETFSQHDAIQ
ncbi:transmembrane protein 231-like [Ixodes scapularis]